MYVHSVCSYFIYWHHVLKESMDKPSMFAIPARGQLNIIFPCSRARLRIWSRKTGSAVPSRVSLLISILRINLVLTYGIPPEVRGSDHLFIINRHTPSGQSRVHRVNCVPMVYTAESQPAQGQ